MHKLNNEIKTCRYNTGYGFIGNKRYVHVVAKANLISVIIRQPEQENSTFSLIKYYYWYFMAE